ncbi:MAG: TonB-dependent receptor [Desulfobacteraceae bacterium]|nr:TonB-dependent receptor [Desulfobacteraceae bacterium]
MGEIETRGLEVEARADLGWELGVVAGYGYTDAEITNDVTQSYIGNTPSLSPRHAASLWLNYALPDETLFTAIFGILLLNDPVSWRFFAGAFLIPGSGLALGFISSGGKKTS